MATIRTALAMYDGVTSPLMQMNNALHIVLNSFEAVQAASGHSVDVSAIQEAREALARAETSFDSIEHEIRQADNQQKNFNQHMSEGAATAETLLSKVKRISAAAGGLFGLNKLVGLSDRMASTEARLNFLVDDGGSIAKLEHKVMASAMRSRSVYFDTAQLVARLGQNAGAAFSGNDELIAFAEQVNKQFVIGGATAQEQSAAMIQLTQAMAAGALRGDELNSILEGGAGIARAIESYMGIAEGSIKEYAKEGKITAEVVKNALFAAADETNEKFSSMLVTWDQVFTMGSNVALIALNPLFQGISFLANNIKIIGPAVLGLGAAFMVFQVAAHGAQIATAATSAYHAVVGFLSIAFGILTGNTAAASAAVFTFNSALLGNPITWVVMLITILIGSLYAGVGAYNKFTNSSVSATGIITGAFGVMVAFVGNHLIHMYNMFAAIANFVGNVFNDPTAAVKILFYDMAMTCIGYIISMAKGIESVINKIPGVQVNITSGLNNLYAGLERGAQQVKDASGWKEYVQRKDFIDYTDYAQKGYNMGEGFVNKVKDTFGFGGGIDAYNTAAAYDSLCSAADDTAGNTARMADALDMTEENIAYMRDIAEREAINRFTTAEIKIEQHNENHITSDLDVDGIMDQWCDYFAERMDVSSEGVHE